MAADFMLNDCFYSVIDSVHFDCADKKKAENFPRFLNCLSFYWKRECINQKKLTFRKLRRKKTRLLVSGRSPERSDCLLRFMEQK